MIIHVIINTNNNNKQTTVNSKTIKPTMYFNEAKAVVQKTLLRYVNNYVSKNIIQNELIFQVMKTL